MPFSLAGHSSIHARVCHVTGLRYLAENDIVGDGVAAIAAALLRNTALRILGLNGASALPPPPPPPRPHSCTHAFVVRVRCVCRHARAENWFGDGGATALGASLEDNTTLETLHIAGARRRGTMRSGSCIRGSPWAEIKSSARTRATRTWALGHVRVARAHAPVLISSTSNTSKSVSVIGFPDGHVAARRQQDWGGGRDAGRRGAGDQQAPARP